MFKAALQMPPYKTEVECSVYNSGNDVSKQTQQISNLISQGVDAILVDAASRTGLNGDHPAGLRASASSSSPTTTRHRAVCDQDRHGPVRLRRAERAVPRREAQGQGQRDHGHGRGRHAGRHRPQQGCEGRLREEPGHQGRRQVHRHVGFGDRSAQHGARSCRRCRRSTASGRPAAPTGSSRRSSRPGGRCRRSSAARARTASAGSSSATTARSSVRHLARPAAVQRRRGASSSRGRCSPSRTRRPRRQCGCRSRRRPRRRRSSA